MPFKINIHYDNAFNFAQPHIWIWYDGSAVRHDLAPSGADDFGPIFTVDVLRSRFKFKFKDGSGTNGPWEDASLDRIFEPQEMHDQQLMPNQIWIKGDKAFVYDVHPRGAETSTAAEFLQSPSFKPESYVPGSGGFSGLGATVLQDGRVLFGLYHPNAARVYVMGSFNDWQRPSHDTPDPDRFLELKLYQGYFGIPNLWLGVSDKAKPSDEYKFHVQGGVPRDYKNRMQRYVIDPYSRRLSSNFRFNNSVIEDPSTYNWQDDQWQTPGPRELILYELSVHGFTDGDPDIAPENHGRFRGITERIRDGYFNDLGVTALSLMPLAETPSVQSPTTLGYNPSLYCTVERDFGTPYDLRELVDTAHQKGLAVILDQVFNHTDNNFNPLWNIILEHPDEVVRNDGGLYFSGGTPWGNRIATEKEDVQNMLIDACKLLIKEFHVDGFRFDATHTNYMDHRLLDRLATELKGFKPEVILIAENLPNQADLNRNGFDGYAQWCDTFHDKMKALLREGEFEHKHYNTNRIGDIFFFSKQEYAAHTNNTINYCESHDENSVPYEVGTNPVLNHPAAKERKSRLGLFATMVGLGQPMLYMGQEFNVERPRNIVTVSWPDDTEMHGYYQWAHRLIQLRRRYPAMRLEGYNPVTEGHFNWVAAPWLDGRHGGGEKVIGWWSQPGGAAHERVLVMMNFENHDVELDVEFGVPGKWIKLADIDQVDDLPPFGGNNAANEATVESHDGRYTGFRLPSSSGFIYKWEAAMQ